jgi:hypothetical protein
MEASNLCVSAYWRDDMISLSSRGSDEPLLLKAGEDCALATSEERWCVGWRHPLSGDTSPCPDGLTLQGGGSQCKECVDREVIIPCHRCTGERCGNPVRREKCIQPDNHNLYLAAFAPGLIKVGVARTERVLERVAEQGARAAVVLACADGKEIRNMEYHCRRIGYPDRLALSTKINAWSTPAHDDALHLELERAGQELRSRLRGSWYKEPERLVIPELQTLETKPRQLAHMADLRLRGQVVAVYGYTAIVHSDAGDAVAFEGSSLVGYWLRSLRSGEVGESQMALAI